MLNRGMVVWTDLGAELLRNGRIDRRLQLTRLGQTAAALLVRVVDGHGDRRELIPDRILNTR